MDQRKEVVLITGASGSMGFQTFLCLWEMRDRYNLVLLLRPSKKNKKKFRSYELEAGITPFPGKGTAQGSGLKIVWGDALNRDDLVESCQGIDWCLHTMALISPAADRDPEMALKVNTEVTRNLVQVIESMDPDRIRLIHIGSLAQYGDRLPPIHVGRTGDPLVPNRFDTYALSKIDAELAVMESRIRQRVSLRQTFIMIPDLFSLKDPIMFHQPLHSMMENITARDAGRMLAACLDVTDDSDFWRNFYNISGGPGCRTTYLAFLDRIYRMLGLDYRRVMKRNWFALKNFHMHFFGDAGKLNGYLRHWKDGQVMEDFYSEVWAGFPWYLKATAWFNKWVPPFRWLVEKATYLQLKRLTGQEEGTLRWIRQHHQERIIDFFGSCSAWKEIPGWDRPLPSLDIEQPFQRLDHGYDESKEQLVQSDLQEAARFRGGSLQSAGWKGDMDQLLEWKCCQGHDFRMTPRSVLLGGHWCRRCIDPPWDYEAFAGKNSFAAQVLKPDINI
jgi:nucleoside-diphosphate-sugar epimerase